MTPETLRLSGIYKQYGIKRVLEGIDLSVNHGQRIALVGENGTGKSTLLRIIAGQEQADAGRVDFAPGAQVGYLPQEVRAESEISVQQSIEQATGALATLRERLQTLEAQMTQPLPDAQLERVLSEYGALQEQFERRGGYDIDARIQAIFAGLGIDYIAPQRPLHTLSGGERTRVALTGLLLRAPDLLLLDEPTNHLDFAGIDWLERYLAAYDKALLIVTHDREFINRVATIISELHPKTRTLTTYHGSYEDYLQQREREYQEQVAAYNAQAADMKMLKRTIKQLGHNRKITGVFSDSGDKYLKHFKRERGESLLSKEIRDARLQLERLEADRMANPRHEWRIEFRFDPLPLPSSEPLRLEGLTKRYGDTVLFSDAQAVVHNGERVVLVAPNGTGKSTLLRIILGLEHADAGRVRITDSSKIGFLDQDGETFDPQQRVLDCLREVTQGSDSELLAELHRSGLFSDASLGDKRIADLSVGQRRKLGLARIIASRANLLLLDEPTNHLDPLSLEALEEALMQFQGALLAVSHDRRFVRKVATRVWHIEHGALVERQERL